MHVSDTTRHPVDELAEVRTALKALADREAELKAAVSALMGQGDSLAGTDYVAFQKLSARKGAVDAEAIAKVAGINVDEYRKPPVAVLSIVIEKHAATTTH